ncbi:phosphorylase [Haloarchaeobius sp. DFWS5]|uniref:phosphorylase family protein n=1 Tax=Haloarchaeobius sp. DFWS5 TaxID=3446114 RepID=UPI003EC04F4C
MSIAPDVLVFPAFVHDADTLDERQPWLDRYDFDHALDVSGVPEPLQYTDAEGGLVLLPTGMGKSKTASTVTAALTTPALDLSDTLFLSVGVAGGPPTRTTLGSVVVAAAVVDWDVKVRWDEREGDGGDDVPLALNPYRENDLVYRPDDELLDWATGVAQSVELADDPALDSHRTQFGQSAARSDPGTVVGTNVCGDEFWHGRVLAEQVEWLCEQYGASPYCATEMEDAATATVLDRFGRLDDYLSVRGVANFDRPAPGESVAESLDGDLEAGFDLGLTNAVAVASALVDRRRD